MSVTGVSVAEREEKLRQIERIVGSELLHGSESLCKLLRYLAEHCIDHPGAGVKEYEIATDLFKRPADFDPRIDAMVRVQTGRLRSKLAEYYAGPGAKDHWIIEIPKGAYALTCYPRPAPVRVAEIPAAASQARDTVLAETPPRTPSARPWLLAVLVLSAAVVLLVVALVAVSLERIGGGTAAKAENPDPPAGLAFLWNDFVATQEPWVIFSNAEFVGRPETGIHYFNPATDKARPIFDHYTGVGEVLGIHELDQVFASLHRGLRVKRGRLLSLDDAQNNDLIFVGSPSENLSLREIPTTRDFVFQRMTTGPRKGDLSITIAHPGPGEGKYYLASEIPLTEDYAVIGLMPGLNPTRRVMLLAGITTIGTQAAVEYVSHPDSVENLLNRIGRQASGKIVPFEAILRVKVSQGVPVQSEIIALRLRR
jgi:hypothetical protein